MSSRSPQEREVLRSYILLFGLLSFFIILGVDLWRIQVAHGHEYEHDLRRQSVRRIRLPGRRGSIYDRNGMSLAENRPSYCVAIYLEELRQPGAWSNTVAKVEEVINELAIRLNMEPQISRVDILRHVKKRLPLPLIAWRGLSEKGLAIWAEKAANLPGVGISVETVRTYPYNDLACHVLGYVGRAPLAQNEKPFHYYLPEMQGKSGLERQFDEELKGSSGGHLVRVDVSGFRYENLGGRDPVVGQDIMLALDARVQKIVEQAMKDWSGSAVVINPQNGDVLAMVSNPGFDCNAFSPAISTKEWKSLLNNPEKPLLNRSISGRYSPGSCFKPIVAMAVIEGAGVRDLPEYHCPGYFKLGKSRMNCWYEKGHKLLNVHSAIMHSCNTYFFNLALENGYDVIYHMAAAMGIGIKTGIEMDGEVAGLLPDSFWKKRVYNDGWRDGDTCNLSIGQGALVVTPLQMAVATAAFANKGRVYKPRLVLGTRKTESSDFQIKPPVLMNDMHWSEESLKIVREAMRDVIMSPRGTGRLAGVPGITMAGKTGTAEYGKKNSGLKYGWMIAFAPYEKPKYAIALVVERADSGGNDAAPLINEIIDALEHGGDPFGGAG